jgi:hypothetical protein
MSRYKCMRCGYESKRKDGMRRHLSRKFMCLPVLNNIDTKYMLTLLESGNYINFQNEIYNFICKHCNKNFSTNFSLNRHLKDNHINTNQNIINNVTNNNIKINNIIVNNFGNENTDYLSINLFKSLLTYPRSCIPKLIKQIHFNPEHPENHNIRIKNKKLKYAEIKENNGWKIQLKKTVLDDLVDFGYITLEEFKEDNNLDDLLVKGFAKMMDSYNTKKKQIIKDVELEVLNGSKNLNL